MNNLHFVVCLTYVYTYSQVKDGDIRIKVIWRLIRIQFITVELIKYFLRHWTETGFRLFIKGKHESITTYRYVEKLGKYIFDSFTVLILTKHEKIKLRHILKCVFSLLSQIQN